MTCRNSNWICASILFLFSITIPAHAQIYSAPLPTSDGGYAAPVGDRGIPSTLGEGKFKRWPVHLSLAVREGYDNNVNTTHTNPTASSYTNIALGLTYSFGSSRLQFNLGLTAGATYYPNRPGDKTDNTYGISIGAIYLATDRLTLSFNTYTAYLNQPDTTIIGTNNRQVGDYYYSNSTFAATYQFSRKVSFVASYNFQVFSYVDQNLNDQQGRIQQTLSLAYRYLLLPKTTVVAEYRVNPTSYFSADLNSFNQFLLTGFDQIFNPRFIWNLRVGAQVGLNQNQTDGPSTYIGPYMESTLTYKLRKESNLAWTMRYGTSASGLNGVTQTVGFSTGLNLNHAFTQRISASLGLNYSENYYQQQGVIQAFYEGTYNGGLTVNYKIWRWLSAEGGLQYTTVASGEAVRSYNRAVGYLGLVGTY